MAQTRTESGITFPIDAVAPATFPLRELPLYQRLSDAGNCRLESCSDYFTQVVRGPQGHSLLEAVHLAYSQHRPLVLSPDAVWITIAQGVAHHMAKEGERLRSTFVSHSGKLKLVCKAFDWIPGSPENPWADAFDVWAQEICDYVGTQVYDTLICDFSTSGRLERSVSHIVMMDIFQQYFEYELLCVCGIPSITLEGTVTDWRQVRRKVDGLRRFDLDWWLEYLIPVCDQFVEASAGKIDLKHWQDICKLRREYGRDRVNGWIAYLFPYLREGGQGPACRRNPIFETAEGFGSSNAPSGLSEVPFRWVLRRSGAPLLDRQMNAIGGFVGVTQHPETLALKPMLGWQVREVDATLGVADQ